MVANHIKEITGGEVFRISTVHAYPTDYNAVVDVASQEQKKRDRPGLSHQVANMEAYDVVFVGYPNWWSTMPMAVFSFLESHDFSGKTIVPFCTHEGSAMGRSVRDLRELCPRSVILDGLAIRGGHVKAAKDDVAAWLGRLGIGGK